MDLLEYQAKQLFEQVGIPILPSQSISCASELKNLHIPYPIVLKSQVLASGRAKAGGVKFVENTIDAIAVAQSIFNLPIEGEYPEVILAEARYDAENEFFLAIMLDYALKKPVLLGSSHGGINIEILLDNLQSCIIEEEFSPFYARRLVKQMGLTGKAIASVSKIIEKMYELFINHDLDIIEINPLAINANGEVMALDGKVRVNDYALNRHPNFVKSFIRDTSAFSHLDLYTQSTLFSQEIKQSTSIFDSHSNLAIISDSEDLAILLINSLIDQEQKINNCYLLSPQNKDDLISKMNDVFNYIISEEKIKLVLINISYSIEIIEQLSYKIATYYQKQIGNITLSSDDRADRPTGSRLLGNHQNTTTEATQNVRNIHWIIKSNHPQIITYQEKFNSLPVQFISDLEQTITLIINHSQFDQIKEQK